MLLTKEEHSKLRTMGAWLHGAIIRTKEAWDGFEGVKQAHNEDCGAMDVAGCFTPVVLIALRAAGESVDYALDLDKEAEHAKADGHPSQAKEFTDEFIHTMDVLFAQWISIHSANCGLISAWRHLGVEINIMTPSVTLEPGEPRPVVVDVVDEHPISPENVH